MKIESSAIARLRDVDKNTIAATIAPETSREIAADLELLAAVERGDVILDGELIFDRIDYGSAEYLATAPGNRRTLHRPGSLTDAYYAEREWLTEWRAAHPAREVGWYEVTTDFGLRSAAWWNGEQWRIPGPEGTSVLDSPAPIRLVAKEA